MKRLYLARHAESPSAYGLEDIDRPLSDQGLKDAQALGAAMAKHNLKPDFALCSSAVRTRQTFDGITQSFDYAPPAEFTQDIYRGSPHDYFELIQNIDDRYSSALLVGHNPVIPSLAASLGDNNSPHYMKLLQGYAPATLTILDCDCESWATLKPKGNAFYDLIAPPF